jgi:transposase
MLRRFAEACPRCAADVLGQTQTCRHRYAHIEIPPIRPHVTRIELYPNFRTLGSAGVGKA